MPDATFLDFAADVKQHVSVPIIAVGRLGDPATAEAAVASGKTDFIALADAGRRSAMGRESRARRTDPPLPRLQHLHQRHARRRAHRLRGQWRRRPRDFVRHGAAAARRAHRGDRRRSGRSHLCGTGGRGKYGSGFRKSARPGGSFRYAGKAPLFQEVEANEKSFERYIADLVAACEFKGVVFRLRPT